MAETDTVETEVKNGTVDTGTETDVAKDVRSTDTGDVASVETEKPHPLDPGGERFKEVWARAKKAESETQREREARLVAEAKLETLQSIGSVKTVEKEKVYTWAELERFIENGQMTRAEASEYREAHVLKKAVEDAKRETAIQMKTETKMSQATSELDAYFKAVPDIGVLGTETRQKVEAEWNWLANMYGTPTKGSVEERAMELNSVRNVLGPLDGVSTKKDSDRLTRRSRETMAESNSTANRSTDRHSGKDPLDSLTVQQKQHYEKMFQKTNDYPNGWDDVRKELTWQKPSLVTRTR